MSDHGIIYQAPGKGKKLAFYLFRGIGAGLIAFAVVGIIFSFYPIVKDEISYSLKKPRKIGFGDLIARSDARSFGLDPYFSVYVPKINAKAKVIPNVSPGVASEYNDALQQGVAHAKGTNFPGQGKLIYLFSHSTDSPLNFAQYNAVFYLLRKMETGDRIIVYFMGKEYDYVVVNKVIAEAEDTSWLKDNGSGETLVLQTCDPPGTSWNRLLLVAKPI